MYAHHHGVLQSAITTKIYKHYLRAPQGRILDFEMHWFLCVWPQPLSGPPCPAYNSSKRKRSFRIFPFTPFMFRTLEMNKTNLYICISLSLPKDGRIRRKHTLYQGIICEQGVGNRPQEGYVAQAKMLLAKFLVLGGVCNATAHLRKLQ